ncbi:MAG TPA: hypothetical protein VH120_13635 [Gemmataceae bacterium]|nr:hypothetical protein [Gemmataceae bacterium]
MPQITLTEEQFKVYETATEPVEIRAPDGEIVIRLANRLPHETPEFFAELKRRADTPGRVYTSDQVRRRMAALQAEWDRTGGFDKASMREFMKKLDETDPPQMQQRGKAS